MSDEGRAGQSSRREKNGQGADHVVVSTEVVSETATTHGVDESRLVEALSLVGRDDSVLSLAVLFDRYEPRLLDVPLQGGLALGFEDGDCWRAEFDRLELGERLESAVLAAHQRQVEVVADEAVDHTVVVLPVPTVTPPVQSRAVELSEGTSLDALESLVHAVTQVTGDETSVVDRLGISPGSAVSVCRRVKSKLQTARSTVDLVDSPSPLSTFVQNPTASNWLGLDWSDWIGFDDESGLREIPSRPGLYRVRHTESGEIVYIGESGARDGLQGRVHGSLVSGVYDDQMPSEGSHPARQRLWELRRHDGGGFEVSTTSPPVAADERSRLSIEATAIATHRRTEARSPRVQFGRSVPEESGTVGTSPSEDPFEYPPDGRSLAPPDWTNWQEVDGDQWLGLDWTTPTPLSRRSEVDDIGECVYRLWHPRSSRRLTFVGEAQSPKSRLYRAQREYGKDTVFSLAHVKSETIAENENYRRRLERKSDLLGAHFLATGEPPRIQYRSR